MAAPVTFFSILMGALRPLPVEAGDRVVQVIVTQPSAGGAVIPVVREDLRLLRGSGSMESVGAFMVEDGTLVDPILAATRLSVAGPRLATEVLRLAFRQLLPAVGIGLHLAWLAAPILSAVSSAWTPGPARPNRRWRGCSSRWEPGRL